MSDRPQGSWALVLGCSVGAGAEIARTLARCNQLNVLGFHRGHHTAEAAELQAEIRERGLRCELVEANAGKLETIPELADEVGGILDGDTIKVLIHSLADASVGPLVHPSPDAALQPRQLLKSFEVMAHSFVFWGQHLFTRGLFGPQSQIVGLLNYLERHVCEGGGAIGASKAALSGYMRYMAGEYAAYGVRVNGIRFGPVDTFASRHVPGFAVGHAAFAALNPMGRNGNVSDVANMVSLLLDPRAGFVNGEIISVDGGEERSIIKQMARG
jgi:NAD(P)-dependent dehydrogenase (short-subunit alcohol dehydrogenase family)